MPYSFYYNNIYLLTSLIFLVFLISGVLDTQVPISDTYRLLSAGDVPRTAWINPHGGHLGRQKGVWPDPLIFREVIIPWIVHALATEPQPK